MNTKIKILFTSTFETPFINIDFKLLSEIFFVTRINRAGIRAFFSYLIKLPLNDVSFSWFLSIYSAFVVLLSKIFDKKSIIVLGGIDTAKLPELDYGIWTKRWKSVIVRWGIKNASQVLAVDESLKKEIIEHARYSGNNIIVLPTGYDDTKWFPSGIKKNNILTVANIPDETRAKIKGLDFFLAVAEKMKTYQFFIIGVKNSVLSKRTIPSNVITYEYLAQEDLVKHYQEAKVYFQPSLREGLPNTLCEAMLCECVPVGTNTGGIPNAIEKTGFIVEYFNIEQTITAINEAMISEFGGEARKRIQKKFSISQRKEVLSALINSLHNG